MKNEAFATIKWGCTYLSLCLSSLCSCFYLWISF